MPIFRPRFTYEGLIRRVSICWFDSNAVHHSRQPESSAKVPDFVRHAPAHAVKGRALSKAAYPRVEEIGLTIHRDKPGIAGISADESKAKLSAIEFAKLCDLMMGQTSGANGWYVYDVEAALERIISGKRTGTQLAWD